MEQIRTKTMAEIYLKQGHLLEAYEILKDLAEKYPSDQEVVKKLRILRLKMGLISSPIHSPVPPEEDKVELLRKWLSNIQSRRKK